MGEVCKFIWHFWDFSWSFMSALLYSDVGKKQMLSDFFLFVYNDTNGWT